MDSGIVLSSKSVSEDENIAEITPDGRYVRYKEVLGRGAFKVVYRGFDQEYGMEIAWNQISIDDIALQSPEHQKSLLAEADLVKSLRHENVIKCYCSWVDTDSQTINMITELFSSGCLRQYRRKHKSVDIKAIKNWARQILRGLLYLHCHNPVIIHRDLKCDNIFVNGNLGEVKIGDLGFAAIMRQGTARSVVGTPEFMAPELYDEEYNELVDIYSFGMCMLELITCEYPYSECKNQAQVYKKVTSGIKPAAFSKVKDPDVRRFIEKCLVPASERLSAAELLKDPFLSSDSSEKLVDKTVLVPATVLVQKITDFPKPDSQVSMDIVSDCGKLSAGTFVKSMSGATSSSTLELQKSTDDNAFRLQGKKAGDGSIEFSLCFNNLECTKENYEFLFDPAIDCALSIACELVEQHVLAVKNVPLVAELMDSLLLRFVPGWRASCGNYILKKNSCEDSEVILESPKIENHGAEESVLSDLYLSAKSNSTCTLDARPADDISDCESIMMSGCTNLSGFSYVDLSSAKSCDLSVDAVLMVEKGHDKDWFQGFMQDPNGIRMQCELGCCELLRAWENALESAKKKWISNLKLPVV